MTKRYTRNPTGTNTTPERPIRGVRASRRPVLMASSRSIAGASGARCPAGTPRAAAPRCNARAARTRPSGVIDRLGARHAGGAVERRRSRFRHARLGQSGRRHGRRRQRHHHPARRRTSPRSTRRATSAVINWQSFSIGPNETTIYQQPSASSISLNRVIGPILPSSPAISRPMARSSWSIRTASPSARARRSTSTRWSRRPPTSRTAISWRGSSISASRRRIRTRQ